VIQGLRQAGLRVALIGGDGDRAAAEAVAHAVEALGGEAPPARVGGMSLGEVAGLLSQAALLLGADSGLLHVAAAMGTPVVGLYGPTDPAAWAPVGGRVLPVRSPVACSPCLYQAGRPPLRVACAEPFCMHAIPSRSVIEAALATLRSSGRAAAGVPPHRAGSVGATAVGS
jgi:heptosyltransferase-3